VPNQREVRWSQLKVGVLVITAIVALTALIFLMSGSSGGLFTRRITVHSFFENAAGLKPGAPVDLQGVTIGTVEKILVVPERKLTPVEVIMKISLRYQAGLRKDSLASLDTIGVLGDTVVDIDSSHANGPALGNGDELPTNETPNLADVIKSSQGTIEQFNVILAKLNTLVDALGTGKGSLGQLINDPALYNRAVGTINQLQDLFNAVNQGQGSLGKLVTDNTLYNRANDTVARLQKIADEMDAGQGTAGKLLKDPSLYNNLNQTAAKTNHLLTQIDEGKGTLGMLAKDEAFRRKINSTVTNLQSILQRADEGRGTVGKLLHDPALYNHSDQAVAETRELLIAIRKNPKKYLSIRLRIF
jgi:phospholipid/cholesterol/gamma-HCH transport system substrate-binding protein